MLFQSEPSLNLAEQVLAGSVLVQVLVLCILYSWVCSSQWGVKELDWTELRQPYCEGGVIEKIIMLEYAEADFDHRLRYSSRYLYKYFHTLLAQILQFHKSIKIWFWNKFEISFFLSKLKNNINLDFVLNLLHHCN